MYLYTVDPLAPFIYTVTQDKDLWDVRQHSKACPGGILMNSSTTPLAALAIAEGWLGGGPRAVWEMSKNP